MPLAGHSNTITSGAFAADGTRIVTASMDGTARVWSPAGRGAWSPVALHGHTAAVTSARFSPDGRQLVTTSADGTARLWRENGDGVEAALFTPSYKRTFAHATAVLDELGMTIMDARVVPLENGYSIDSFVFMELDDRVEIDESRMQKIRRSLTRVLTGFDDNVARVTRSLPRQARMFTTRTSVEFSPVTSGDNTVMELVAADRPGLLSIVGQVFIEQEVDIEAAKIMTIGERAEDVFYISDEAGNALEDSAQQRLREALLQRLDSDFV